MLRMLTRWAFELFLVLLVVVIAGAVAMQHRTGSPAPGWNMRILDATPEENTPRVGVFRPSYCRSAALRVDARCRLTEYRRG